MQRFLLVILTYVTILVAMAWAAPAPEKAAMPTAAMQKMATHIVQGEVIRIYKSTEVDGPWEYTRFIAEMKVSAIEKGKGIEKEQLIYPRWFSRHWRRGEGPASGSGHYGWTPKVGEKARAYLAKNSSDGFNRENNDGGFSLLVPNGFEKVTASQK